MNRQIPILYEDASICILDKPAGITVNRSDTTRGEETVQDFTEKHLQLDQLTTAQKEALITIDERGYENEFFKRGGIVHRLDKETSGILVVAKNPQAFLHMQKQFHDREVEKSYLALVHGVVSPAQGEIAIPVDRLPWNRKRFGVIPGGRPSETIYTVLRTLQNEKKERFSLLELSPKTGRTHQIRVHMKYLNHPIFSDMLYGGRKTARDDRKVLERIFLHAATITFSHPQTGQRLSFSSKLPEKLEQFLHSYLQEMGEKVV